MANLLDYATHILPADSLFDVWTTRSPKTLHAVLRSRTPGTSFTPSPVLRPLVDVVCSGCEAQAFERGVPGAEAARFRARYASLILPCCGWTRTGGLAHQAAVSLGLRASAPSSASKVDAIARQQEKYPIYNGRPPVNCGFDVRLFHPAFENFTKRCYGKEKLANEENAAVHNFLVCSAGYYANEKARQGEVTPILATLLGGRGLTDNINLDGTSADGTITYSSARTLTPIPLLYFELKNEIGAGDADATHQVGLLYRKFWSLKKVPHLFPFVGICSMACQDGNRASCCPTFLLTLMGSWLCVLGAVFTDRPIVQPLTPLLWLGHVHARKPQYRKVTRLFAALSTGILELEEFYSHLDFKLVSEARFFPHITSFNAGPGHKVQFSYEKYADPIPNSNKAVFIANTQDDQNRKIVIKFTEAYNEKAHSLLAANGLAPPLLSCDRSTFSDFIMVVMGYVDGKQLFHKYPQETPSIVLRKVSGALKVLHENDLVFGDLRSPNILVTAQHDVQLVDFDWCGTVGKGEYPADINLIDIEWPKGVVPGGPLQFIHDEEMLRRLEVRG